MHHFSPIYIIYCNNILSPFLILLFYNKTETKREENRDRALKMYLKVKYIFLSSLAYTEITLEKKYFSFIETPMQSHPISSSHTLHSTPGYIIYNFTVDIFKT